MSKVIVGITYENFSKMITTFIDDLLGALFKNPFSKYRVRDFKIITPGFGIMGLID